MSLTAACPIGGTPRPTHRASCEPWYSCPACDQPVTVNELLDQEVAP